MQKRGFTNPAPKTESARAAVKSFYCELCSKGYSRMNEYDAHLSSYDHLHKQRGKEMRQLTRDPMASEKARKAEAKANTGSGLISIKIGGEPSVGAKKGGFKKAGFKSAFAPTEPVKSTEDESTDISGVDVEHKSYSTLDQECESDTEEEGYQMYDPRYPTD